MRKGSCSYCQNNQSHHKYMGRLSSLPWKRVALSTLPAYTVLVGVVFPPSRQDRGSSC